MSEISPTNIGALVARLKVMVNSHQRAFKGKTGKSTKRYPVEVKQLTCRILESGEVTPNSLKREVGLSSGAIYLWKGDCKKNTSCEKQELGISRKFLKTGHGFSKVDVKGESESNNTYDIELAEGAIIKRVRIEDLKMILREFRRE